MKIIIQSIFLIAICVTIQAQSYPNNYTNNLFNIQFRAPDKVDFKDTVIFNMSKAVIKGGFIDIPISIKADDDIVALDFAMRFDEINLKYNSIINHTGYITHNEFWNPSDLKLRLSSYSLNRYDKDTMKLLSIRFEMLASEVLCSDIKMIEIWLNGDPCSYKLVCPDGSVPVTNKDFNTEDFIEFYPNPANDHITLKVAENSQIEILDLNSKNCVYSNSISTSQWHHINVQNLANGMYLIKAFNNHLFTTKKLIINH